MILRARIVLPMTAPTIEDGAVALDGGQVRAVGRWRDLRRTHSGEAMDLGDRLLMPGLVNAHCHLDYSDMAGMLSPPRSFPDWIKGLVALKAGWGYSEYAQSWINGARMLEQAGVTTVADIEAVPELLPETWTTTPLRVVSFLELLNVRSWHSARALAREAESRLSALPGHEGRVGLSPHAPYTTSPELLQQAAEVARRRRWPLSSHVSESREEFDMFTRRQGQLHDWLALQRDVTMCGAASPVRFLARLGILGPNFLAAHVNYLAEGDAALLAEQGVSVVHCPESHRFFGHQRFPLQELAAAGVNLCLGTDSLASTSLARRQPARLCLFSEMRVLAGNEPELSAEAIMRMATVNGARALGKAGLVGELTPGAAADLIALPFRATTAEAFEAVLHHSGPVDASLIQGTWVTRPQELS